MEKQPLNRLRWRCPKQRWLCQRKIIQPSPSAIQYVSIAVALWQLLALHQVAYSMMMEKNEEYLHLINPTRCSKDEACTYYRNRKPVIFARGFTNFQKRMYPQQYDKFMTSLILHFGRNQYFKRRRGDILLLPEEQEVIRLMLERVGADSNMDFDKYEEHINWNA